MWLLVGVFLLAAASQYLSEMAVIRFTTLATAKVKGVSEAAMAMRIRRAQRLGAALLVLGAVDVGSVLGGAGALVAAYTGSVVGGWLGTGRVMWARWRRRNREGDA